MISSFSLSDIDCRVYLDGKPETVFYWGTAKGHTDMEAVLKLVNYPPPTLTLRGGGLKKPS